MKTKKALNGKPYAGNPHVRFDEGEVASAATPRRGSLLYTIGKRLMFVIFLLPIIAFGDGFLDEKFKYSFREDGSRTNVVVYGLNDLSVTSIIVPSTVEYEYHDYYGELKKYVCTVVGIKAYAFRNNTTLESVVSEKGIDVDNYSFLGCTSLKNLTIGVGTGERLGRIGVNAFGGCTSLVSVVMGDVYSIGANAFFGCTSLSSVTMLNGVTSIGESAFYNCTNLVSMTLPNSVVSIGDGAFNSCSRLTNVTIPNSVTSIGGQAFDACSSLQSVTIGDGVTDIGDYAFRDCCSLKSITIPDNVVNVGEEMCSGCIGLNTAVVGNGVATLRRTFLSCTNLENVVLGESVKNLYYTFECCSALQSVRIPNGVKVIEWAFRDCTKLSAIAIPSGVEKIGGAFCRCHSLKDVNIPDSVIDVGRYAFAGCWELENVVLGKNITRIGYGMFQGCSSLRNILLPSCVTNIGEYAFEQCRAMDEIFLPSSIERINQGAFLNCTNLSKIVFAGNAPVFEYHWDFGVKAGCTAYVPWGTEGWGVSIPGTWNGINIAYLFTGKKEVDESDLPETIVVQSDAEVTVRSQRTPAELKAQLLELIDRVMAMNRESGQNPFFYTVSGVCDEANGTITLKAAIDPSKIGLEETTSEVVGADALATFKADGTVRLTSAKEGFYYGLAAADRIEDLDAAVEAVKTGGLTRADGDGVSLSAARPSGGSAFFKVVVGDRQRDE